MVDVWLLLLLWLCCPHIQSGLWSRSLSRAISLSSFKGRYVRCWFYDWQWLSALCGWGGCCCGWPCTGVAWTSTWLREECMLGGDDHQYMICFTHTFLFAKWLFVSWMYLCVLESCRTHTYILLSSYFNASHHTTQSHRSIVQPCLLFCFLSWSSFSLENDLTMWWCACGIRSRNRLVLLSMCVYLVPPPWCDLTLAFIITSCSFRFNWQARYLIHHSSNTTINRLHVAHCLQDPVKNYAVLARSWAG